jgi:hypothetical protein
LFSCKSYIKERDLKSCENLLYVLLNEQWLCHIAFIYIYILIIIRYTILVCSHLISQQNLYHEFLLMFSNLATSYGWSCISHWVACTKMKHTHTIIYIIMLDSFYFNCGPVSFITFLSRFIGKLSLICSKLK